MNAKEVLHFDSYTQKTVVMISQHQYRRKLDREWTSHGKSGEKKGYPVELGWNNQHD